MANEAQQLLQKLLSRAQSSTRVRFAVGIALILALTGLAGYFVYGLIPQQYALKITGGDIIGNRHFLTKVLQEEAQANGTQLRIVPTHGSFEGLDMVESGALDMAFVQGGLNTRRSNVQHVATVGAELLHFLVKPGITAVGDLRGKLINLGSRRGGTRIVAKQVLEFSGLVSGIDFVETNYGSEDLVNFRPDKLPEVIVLISFAPSYLAEFLVKERDYEILEIPFPKALAARQGWVESGQISPYMYRVVPPIPARNTETIGMNLHLVANKNVDSQAVFTVLKTLYGPSLGNRISFEIDEDLIKKPSGFPLSQGTIDFINRHDPLLSKQTLVQIQSLFGVIMTVLSGMLVMAKWFKGPPQINPSNDARFKDYIGEVVKIERQLASASVSKSELDGWCARLATLKAEALEGYVEANLNDPTIMATLLFSIDDTRTRLAERMSA